VAGAQEQSEQHDSMSDRHRAIASATAALAGAAATFALRKALKRDDPDNQLDEGFSSATDEGDHDESADRAPDEGQEDNTERVNQEFDDDDPDRESVHGDGPEARNESVAGSALSGAWRSAAHTLIPLAETAATAAGRWTAEHSPTLLRDRLIPRLIDAFDEASRRRPDRSRS
jgi:hypothetical protein